MTEIFSHGGVEVSVPEVVQILTKTYDEADYENEDQSNVHRMLDSFLNGLIIYKRGKQEPKHGQSNPPEAPLKTSGNVNNLLLKKVKIALSLTTDDILDIFDNAGLRVSKGELGALLRKEGHKNDKECGDNFARNFLKRLVIKYRG